jgi:hypothetical protein
LTNLIVYYTLPNQEDKEEDMTKNARIEQAIEHLVVADEALSQMHLPNSIGLDFKGPGTEFEMDWSQLRACEAALRLAHRIICGKKGVHPEFQNLAAELAAILTGNENTQGTLPYVSKETRTVFHLMQRRIKYAQWQVVTHLGYLDQGVAAVRGGINEILGQLQLIE